MNQFLLKESERESVERELRNDTASLILNVSGKVVLVQRERTNTDELLYSAPTVLAGQCEQVRQLKEGILQNFWFRTFLVF